MPSPHRRTVRRVIPVRAGLAFFSFLRLSREYSRCHIPLPLVSQSWYTETRQVNEEPASFVSFSVRVT